MNSMTGFGRGALEKNSRNYIIEMKSVNHKYSDITVKAPRSLLFLEEKIRKKVLERISRGKIDIYITYSNLGTEGKKVIFNKELAKIYIEELKNLASENNINANIEVTEISKMPEIFNMEEDENKDLIEGEILEVLSIALDNFIEMRQKEGSIIKKDLEERIEKFKQNVDKISENSTNLVQEYIVKLENRIKEILKTNIVDESRLAQEIVIYADKCSIEEELTRLKSHIEQFKDLIEKEEPVGKRLDFLIQEMNRELNTIGSKSGSLEITNLVVELKATLEDIREQTQNIE